MSLLEAVLVRGRGRSGTTMLMGLLATAPTLVTETTYPAESRYLGYLQRVADVVAAPWQEGDWTADEMMGRQHGPVGPMPFPVSVVDRDELRRRALFGLWSAFGTAARSAAPGPLTHYAEKYHDSAVTLLDAGIPVRQLRLIRDPRDAFVSVGAFNERRGFAAFGRQEGQSDEAYLDVFVGWVRHDEATIDRDVEAGAPTLVVRYEDLIVAPAAEAARIGSWLGLELDVEAVTAGRGGAAHHITAPSGVDGSVGRWRDELAPELADRLGAELAPVLARYGYA